MKALLPLALLGLAIGAAPAIVVSPAEKSAAASITQDVLRAHVGFLASDLLEGRGASTRADQLAEQYVAAQFEMLALKPSGSKGFNQAYKFIATNGHSETLSFCVYGKYIYHRQPHALS